MFFLHKAFTAKLADLLYSQLISVTIWMRSAVKGEKNLNNQTLLCWQQWRRSTYFEQKTPPAGPATVENINGVVEDMLTHQQAHLLASVSCVSFSWCLLAALSVY